MKNMSRQIQFGIMAITLLVMADDPVGSYLINVALYLTGGVCLFMSFRHAEWNSESRE